MQKHNCSMPDKQITKSSFLILLFATFQTFWTQIYKHKLIN